MLESRNAELKARFEAMRLERQRLIELLNTRRPSIIVQAPGSNKPCSSKLLESLETNEPI
uniref:Transposase n=1 Tax=Eptatretus burgeri TaxID=7764 RepID=A0A8C4QGG9_EPTBU